MQHKKIILYAFVISGLQVQLLSPAPKINAQTMKTNRLCVFFFAEKASETACAAAAGGQICEWISVDVSGDFCGQRTKTMQEMRKRNAQEGLYRENSEKRPMLSTEIAKSS